MAIKQKIDLLFRFSIFVILTGPCYSQTDELLPGELLKDGEEFISAFGNFRLGFFSPNNRSTDRYLGVWYYMPTDPSVTFSWSFDSDNIKKPVWVANRNAPILDKSGRLTIDGTDGNLKILHDGGKPIVVSSVKAEGNTSASFLINGNFVLYETNSDGSVRRELWQSFDYPTDTLLPGMKLGFNGQTGQRWFLQSWVTDESPAQGSYSLGIDPSVSNQLTIWWRGEVFWTSGQWLNGRFNSSTRMSNGYHFSYISNEQERFFNFSASEETTSFPILRVTSRGLIGAISVSCGFSGCENVMNRSCGKHYSDVNVFYYYELDSGFMSRDGFKFKESDNMTLTDCATKCTQSCSCTAFAVLNENSSTGCEIWSTGASFIKSSSIEGSRRVYMVAEPREKRWWLWLMIAFVAALVEILVCLICYRARRKYKRTEEKKRMSLAIVVGAALLIPLFCYLCYWIGRKLYAKVETIMNRKKLLRELGEDKPPHRINYKRSGGRKGRKAVRSWFALRKKQEKDHNSMKHELNIFDFQTISAATNNFSATNKLGEGGFGPVYKGQLINGQVVAIKRLSRRSGQGIVEFKNEAKLIAKLQHTNLVRLLGCSLHGEERLLVYEFMPNKSLDFFIFNSRRKNLLNWETRFNIIEGIAQGLLYLHKYSRLRVIHRDLKASNILLDDQMNPKISDFGMAKIVGLNETQTNTDRVVGTYGYMSPEYAMNGIVSIKTDVFSFGVLVLEIVSGKKNNSCYHTDHPLNLIGYAWQLFNEGKGLELVDLTLEGSSCPPNEVLRCIHVGLLCVQDHATDRPTTSDVFSMLNNESVALPMPKQPAFFIDVTSEEPEVIENNSEVCSINNVTISVMEAR